MHRKKDEGYASPTGGPPPWFERFARIMLDRFEKNDERFRKNDERFRKNDELFKKNDRRFLQLLQALNAREARDEKRWKEQEKRWEKNQKVIEDLTASVMRMSKTLYRLMELREDGSKPDA